MTLKFAVEIRNVLTYLHITQYRPLKATVVVGKGGVGNGLFNGLQSGTSQLDAIKCNMLDL